jgi:anti-sigma B factor antagonist
MGDANDQAGAAGGTAADATTADSSTSNGDRPDSDLPDSHRLHDIARFEVEPGTETVVRVAGELDALSGSKLRALLAQAFDDHPSAVVVDLGEVSFIDSVGLSILVTAHNRGEAQSIPFTVRSASPACQRVFEITRLVDVLRLA